MAYGDRTVVEGVDFTLEPGAIGCLLGPSGCGKTTLLRAICGLEPLARGAIVADGVTISTPTRHVAVERRGIGMVFQDLGLLPHLDVAGNVGFGLRAHAGRGPRRAGARAAGPDGAGRQRAAVSRTPCPAACSSAWRWRAHWRRVRACCCWTNPSRASTPRCASTWASRCARSCCAPGPPRCWSRTRRRRRSRWPTGSA